MTIEKIKADLLWDVLPSVQKSVAACDDMPSLCEIIKALISHLTKKVFPDEDLCLVSKDPQDNKLDGATEKAKNSKFVEEITAQAEVFEETHNIEVALI